MTEVTSANEKRRIPFDQPIKMTLLFFHFIGFSIWFGGFIMGEEIPAVAAAMTTVSGVILMIRELYKDGFLWLVMYEGVLTIVKVAILFAVGFLEGWESYLLAVVMLCGILSSHLPKEIREKKIF